MTETEQAKTALAALADREREGSAGSDRHRPTAEAGRESTPGEPAAGTAGEQSGPSVRPAEAVSDTDYRAVIERAVAATEDLDAAAAFVESVGLDRLESAVERAEHEVSGLAADGRDALATFERFRVAAEGPVDG